MEVGELFFDAGVIFFMESGKEGSCEAEKLGTWEVVFRYGSNFFMEAVIRRKLGSKEDGKWGK
jgi:hypothetical protein